MAESNKTPLAPQRGAGRNIEAAENPTSGGAGAPVFRLPKFFTHGTESPIAANADAANADADNWDVEATGEAAETAASSEAATVEMSEPTSEASGVAAPADAGAMATELAAMRDEIERLTEQVTQVNERESSLERVFDTLHAELSDYKNDFLYEHLKPVVRPLLFLFDSIEQFDSEVAMTQSANANPAAVPGLLAAAVVHENVEFFRDQLVEALQVCEVTLMEAPRGAFNAKFHKAVDVMPVARELDGTIVRVVRNGWFLNGQLLRPAEVVVGKFRAPGKPAPNSTNKSGRETR